MKAVYFQSKAKLGLFLMGFENINMFAKGNYRVKVDAIIGQQLCTVWHAGEGQEQQLSAVQKKEYFTKEFIIRYQNEKIELNELIIIETPSFKYSKDSRIILRLTLLKADSQQKDSTKSQYTKMTSSNLIVRFVLNSFCEYCECLFQQPFSSNVNMLMMSFPMGMMIETKRYKHADVQEVLQLKKEVKRLRYNNYLLYNKFKKIMYNDLNYLFTLPKYFVDGEIDMKETVTNQENLLSYLVLYQTTQLTPEEMNYEMFSIAGKNQSLFQIFGQHCRDGTIFSNKMKMEFMEKQEKKYRQYIIREEYKIKYWDQYKLILKDKVKALRKQLQLGNNDETLNNLMLKLANNYEEYRPQQLPAFPLFIHQVQKQNYTEKLSEAQNEEVDERLKPRYVLILAHGYQGCPEDLNLIANGFKRRFKKSKYLILKSYQFKMGEGINQMAESASAEINNYLKTIDFENKHYRIIMAGHSMGGLILRAATSQLEQYKQYMECFVSLGVPHLGYLQGIKFLIRAGISLFSNIYNTPCLDQLSSKDRPDLHECVIYKLSKTANLGCFPKIVLVSSAHDKYVPWHSARLQDFSRDKLKQYNFIEREMIDNILPADSRIQRIDRIQVDFKLNQNMDKLIGRTSHIKFLNDLYFIQLLTNACLPSILDS